MQKIILNIKKRTAQFWHKLNWPKRAVLFLVIASALSFISFVLYNFRIAKTAIIEEIKPIASAENKSLSAIPPDYIRRHIDGVYVKPEAANLYPYAVMIDNDPNARLQSGLAHAQLVYEARAEGGITRFMALFSGGEELKEIGPIRSARPYFVDWARGFNALYVHVGGSPEALDILKNIKMLNLNEFYQGKYFWRSPKKIQPHNVYSSAENFKTYLDKLNAKHEGYEAWQYKDEAKLLDRGEQNIEINYSVDNFLVNWRYDKDNNEYIRHVGGVKYQDADGSEIKAKNIVIMKVAADVIDSELRRRMDTIGEGGAWHCLDGICGEGSWKKPKANSREKIYDLEGKEVKFNAGTTWVEVVQSEGEVVF